MTRDRDTYGRGDGMLEVNCACEAAIVLATPQQVRDGVLMSCGRCAGTPSRPLGRATSGRSPGRPKAPHAHGTAGGYTRHIKERTPACVACKEAHARAKEGWKAR